MSVKRTAMPLSRRDVGELYASSRDARKFVEQRRDPPSKSPGSLALQTLESGAGAVGVGMLAGRMGTTSIGATGIPLGLALGAAGHAAAFFGLAGRYASHLHNLSNGAIDGWLALWGAGRGAQMRLQAGEPAAPIVAGASPRAFAASRPLSEFELRGMAGGRGPVQPLTEAELAAMAQEHRQV